MHSPLNVKITAQFKPVCVCEHNTFKRKKNIYIYIHSVNATTQISICNIHISASLQPTCLPVTMDFQAKHNFHLCFASEPKHTSRRSNQHNPFFLPPGAFVLMQTT